MSIMYQNCCHQIIKTSYIDYVWFKILKLLLQYYYCNYYSSFNNCHYLINTIYFYIKEKQV